MSWLEDYAKNQQSPLRDRMWELATERMDDDDKMVARRTTMRMNADCSATYTKLRDSDEWGVTLHDMEGSPGQRVTVTTRGGKTKLERLDEMICGGENFEIWRIKQ
jgi:hypothetical protein